MNLNAGFATPVDLPFNRTALDLNFQLRPPDVDPGGEGCWLLLSGTDLLVIEVNNQLQLPLGELPLSVEATSPLYLGQWQGRPCRLVSVPAGAALPSQLLRQPLRSSEPRVPMSTISLAGMGHMILHWEETSRHCGHCGGKTLRLPGEWGKKCRVCHAGHYPRIHPCVIGLVIKGNEILLARKAEWADGRYSLVAGFVEFGECLEDAMRRETGEETGIEITNIRYLGSQSWPFPSQLMCGFVADYAAGEIELRDRELADAFWCSLDQLPNLPPKRSIARHLIDRAGEFMPPCKR